MNISTSEYMHVVNDTLKVLSDYKIDDVTKNEVLSILWSLKDLMIGKLIVREGIKC